MLGDQTAGPGGAFASAASSALAREVLDEFTASRAREGEKLAATDRRPRHCHARHRRIASRRVFPRRRPFIPTSCVQRLTEALGGASDERVLQEVAVFATRIDVAEELGRSDAPTSTRSSVC